jgi:hypothetical protein
LLSFNDLKSNPRFIAAKHNIVPVDFKTVAVVHISKGISEILKGKKCV